jgi:ElaB/YqjD/DUF883 family membrane-anchored ribosome-binding protein
MAEAVLRNGPSPEPIRAPQPEFRTPEAEPREAEPSWVPASRALLDELQRRWQELKERVENSATATRRSLATEMSEDAEYVKIRARYYHERQPLEAVGMVAASAFVVGMILGFWRR